MSKLLLLVQSALDGCTCLEMDMYTLTYYYFITFPARCKSFRIMLLNSDKMVANNLCNAARKMCTQKY